MSEFEKELTNKVGPHDRTYNDNELYLGGVLAEHFKDWQPPKPQQAMPVVPEDVDKAIKYLENNTNSTFSDLCDILTNKGLNWLNDFQFKDRRFGFGGLNNKLFILSHLAITGYTVEKEKLFYLKSKMTGRYLRSYTGLGMDDTTLRYEEVDDRRACGFGGETTFTQSEIDDMEVGSYEQIEVKVEE